MNKETLKFDFMRNCIRKSKVPEGEKNSYSVKLTLRAFKPPKLLHIWVAIICKLLSVNLWHLIQVIKVNKKGWNVNYIVIKLYPCKSKLNIVGFRHLWNRNSFVISSHKPCTSSWTGELFKIIHTFLFYTRN